MINIVYNINEYYLKYLLVHLNSLFSNNPNSEFKIFILSDDLKITSKNKLISFTKNHNSEIEFIKIDFHIFEKYPTSNKWPSAIYYRLLLNKILPDNIDKILYYFLAAKKLVDLY